MPGRYAAGCLILPMSSSFITPTSKYGSVAPLGERLAEIFLECDRDETFVMQVTTVGLDLAKNVMQVHEVDATGKPILRKKLRRAEVIAFFTGCRLVSSAWELAQVRTTGHVRSRSLAIRSGLSRRPM